MFCWFQKNYSTDREDTNDMDKPLCRICYIMTSLFYFNYDKILQKRFFIIFQKLTSFRIKFFSISNFGEFFVL